MRRVSLLLFKASETPRNPESKTTKYEQRRHERCAQARPGPSCGGAPSTKDGSPGPGKQPRHLRPSNSKFPIPNSHRRRRTAVCLVLARSQRLVGPSQGGMWTVGGHRAGPNQLNKPDQTKQDKTRPARLGAARANPQLKRAKGQ